MSVSSLTTWTVPQVRAALVRHDDGDFYETAALAEQMNRDPAIFGDLSTRIRALSARSGVPFCVEPQLGVDDRRAHSIAEGIEDIWWDILPEPTAEAIRADALMLGVSVGRVEWTPRAGEWRPRVRHLPAHGLRYSTATKGFKYITGDGKDLDVTPGDGSWFLFLPHGDRSWMWGAVRALGLLWLMRTFTYRDWARYCEKHGMPVLAVKEPFFATDDVNGDASATDSTKAVYRSLAKLGSEATIRLPQGQSKEDGGWDAQWLEPSAQTFDAFKNFLHELRSSVSQVLLGRDSTGPKGGDGELASERVRTESLAAEAEALSTTLRDQVLKPWARFNVASDLEDIAPWPRWDTRPPPDMLRRAQVLNELGDALAKLSANGVDTTDILEEFNLDASSQSPGESAA